MASKRIVKRSRRSRAITTSRDSPHARSRPKSSSRARRSPLRRFSFRSTSARSVALGVTFDEQHGHVCLTQDALGIAPENQAVQTAPTVGAHHDEIGAEFLRLI